jgi:hypothetical protein
MAELLHLYLANRHGHRTRHIANNAKTRAAARANFAKGRSVVAYITSSKVGEGRLRRAHFKTSFSPAAHLSLFLLRLTPHTSPSAASDKAPFNNVI